MCVSYLMLVATLILKARFRVVSLLSFIFEIIVLPFSEKEVEYMLPLSETFQKALSIFSGERSSHYSAGKFWDLFRRMHYLISSITHSSSIPNGSMFFIEGSSSGKGGITGPSLTTTMSTTYKSGQQVELATLTN